MWIKQIQITGMGTWNMSMFSVETWVRLESRLRPKKKLRWVLRCARSGGEEGTTRRFLVSSRHCHTGSRGLCCPQDWPWTIRKFLHSGHQFVPIGERSGKKQRGKRGERADSQERLPGTNTGRGGLGAGHHRPQETKDQWHTIYSCHQGTSPPTAFPSRRGWRYFSIPISFKSNKK